MGNRLSIVIPTFNRKERLLNQLHSIYSQNDCLNVDIVVCDNHSDYNVTEAINKEFDSKLTNNLNVIVNKLNLGMCANLAMSFLNCNTEWMWMLSDDDETLPNSISTVLKDIENYPNAILLKYSIKNFTSHEDFSISSLENFIDYYYKSKYSSGDMIFLSNNVYNMKKVNQYYGDTLSSCYCGIPQLLPAFNALNNKNGHVRFMSSAIVSWLRPEYGKSWNYVKIGLQCSTINQFSYNISELYHKKLGSIVMSGFSHKSVICDCLDFDNKEEGKYIYKRFYNNCFRLYGGIKDRILYLLFFVCYYSKYNPRSLKDYKWAKLFR